MRYVARVTMLFDADSMDQAIEFVADRMSTTQDWDYASANGERTRPMPIESPSVDVLFEAALDNE